MKKWFSLLLTLLLLVSLFPAALGVGPAGGLSVCFFDETSGLYGTPTETERVNITLDGKVLETDGVPALIQYRNGDGRTLIPVRAVAEALDANVVWSPENRQVILLQADSTIVLTLGSPTAMVNGQLVELPGGIPAGVVKWEGRESTMVPLRFVSEQLGAAVTWDNSSFTAVITSTEPEPSPMPEPSPEPSPEPEPDSDADRTDCGFVTGISTDDAGRTISIHTDYIPEYQVIDLGDRVAIDLPGAVLSDGTVGEGKIAPDSDAVSAIRYSQHGDDLGYGYPHTVRVVLDFKADASAYQLTAEQRYRGVVLSLSPAEDVPDVPVSPGGAVIVLDAGHGGTSPGAVYPDADGNDVIERDLTLSITLELERILLEEGYQVVMTRSGDDFVDLYDRADIANAANADLFVSVHINAADKVPTFQGIYTYYHPSSNRSKRFAEAVQQAICTATGGIDRGISSADFVVLRETNMAAVLVECGFMSNLEELANLMDPDYQHALACGIADGIAAYLNSR